MRCFHEYSDWHFAELKAAQPGDLWFLANQCAGENRDWRLVRHHRVSVTECYHIKRVEIHSCSSTIEFVERPGVQFNSVLFEPTKKIIGAI